MIGAAASNLSRDNSRDGEGDGPSPDDLELFTREGLFNGQPRQHALRWEPVEVENVVPPGEDPLELFAPSPDSESSAASEPAETPAAPAAAEARGDVAGDLEADTIAEAPEPLVTRPDSILGLSTTIVAPRERDAVTLAKDDEDDEEGDEGNETTALPFVPIKADPRLSPSPSSPLSSHLHDSVLIDDNSRLDVLDHACLLYTSDAADE